jgi:hypothetical protein
VTTGNQPKRGDVVLFPIQIISGPSSEDQYDAYLWDSWEHKNVRLTVLLPNDTKIIDHKEVSDEVSDEVTGG